MKRFFESHVETDLKFEKTMFYANWVHLWDYFVQ